MNRPDFESALKEIVELIDTAIADKRIRRVSEEQIQIIAVSYQVNPYVEFSETLAEFYRDFLHKALEDKVITEGEAEDLAHLKLVLGLNDRAVERIHEEVVQAIYKRSVIEAVADGRIDSHEREFLEKLQRDLRLSDDIAEQIYQNEAQDYLDRYLTTAINDERLDPDEEAELNAITRSLGVDIALTDRTKAALNKYRLYWVIENGRLPVVEVDIALNPDEVCYLELPAAWYEQENRDLSDRIGSIRFFKSDYQPLRGVTQQPDLSQWQRRDRGTAYLTNQRILLDGDDTRVSIALQDILDIHTYQSGVEIFTATTINPYIAFQAATDIFIVLLGRAIRNLS